MHIKSSAILLCFYLAKSLRLAYPFRLQTSSSLFSIRQFTKMPRGKRVLATSEVVQAVATPEKKRKVSKGSDDDEPTSPSGVTDTKAPHIRDPVPPIALSVDGSYLKIMSWNVNGLKAVITTKREIFDRLIRTHQPDVLCLQETKLQENLVADFRDLLDGYDSYWSCSTVKKGYSGTAVFVKRAAIANLAAPVPSAVTSSEPKEDNTKGKKQAKLSNFFAASKPKKEEAEAVSESAPASSEKKVVELKSVSYDFENIKKQFDGEGRTITLEFDKFYLVACYVPNSGEGLVRLKYRVDEWDPHMRDYLKQLSNTKPVVFTGDLNVGHLDLDIHNPTAKHIDKQAGLTPQERSSFTEMVSSHFHDAFRYLYPSARGQFSYWSQRTFARPVNKGLRLDYFICSRDMFPPKLEQAQDESSTAQDDPAHRSIVDVSKMPSPGVYDSYILHEDTVGCSDHCPVVLVVKV